MKKTVLIYEKPEALFFERIEGMYPPFISEDRGLPYYLYRSLNILGLPCDFYWGEWKRAVKNADRLIIFDYGYQTGMEKLVKKINPDCDTLLFCWNRIDRLHNNFRAFSQKDRIYSTDPLDCKKYGLRFQTTFYCKELAAERVEKGGRILFLGADKNRAAFLMALSKRLALAGAECDFMIVPDRTTTAKYAALCTASPLSYEDYLKKTDECDVLLDIVQPGQRGLTLRVMEALFRSKKLITNNPSVRDLPFYNENNILLLPERGLPGKTRVRDFLEKPYIPCPEEYKEYYSYEAWLSRFDQ